MTQSRQALVTPEKQLTSSRLDLDLDSPTMDDLDCTPNTQAEMHFLKTRATRLFDQGSSNTTSLLLEWRFSVVDQEIEVRKVERQSLLEANMFYEKIG